MDTVCQTCGADPRGDWGTKIAIGDVTEGTCPACGHTLAVPFGRALLSDSDPAVEYEFENWEAEDRATASEVLTTHVVPFRWEPGLIMAVAAHREAEVDAILDELDEAAAVNDGALPEAEDDWGASEDAFAALGDLFDAADRLFHTPTGTTAANDLKEAAGVVRRSEPPYGFNPVLWRTAGELATQLESLLADGSNDDIRAGAEALRDVLAEHI